MQQSPVSIFCTVNSGVYLQSGGFSCLVDGIHRGRDVGFSDMPPALQAQLRAHDGLFQDLQLLLFTHLHPDHFDRALTLQALQAAPPPLLYAPRSSLSTLAAEPLPDGFLRLCPAPDVTVYARPTLHDGERFRNVEHCSYLIGLGGAYYFIAGDAQLHARDAAPFAARAGGRIAAAFLNFYHISSPLRRAFVQALAPERIVLCHLPLPEDDRHQMIPLTRRMARQLPAGGPPVELAPYMQWLDSSPAAGKAVDFAART